VDPRRVRDLVSRQRDTYSWQFVFLGANFDAVAEAARLGVPRSAALQFAPQASTAAMASLGSHVSRLRAQGGAAFDDQDRDDAMNTPPRSSRWRFGRKDS